jgi:hypothetical protein
VLHARTGASGDSDKPKPPARRGWGIQKAAREYLRMLQSLNPDYDAKAAMSVVVMKAQLLHAQE